MHHNRKKAAESVITRMVKNPLKKTVTYLSSSKFFKSKDIGINGNWVISHQALGLTYNDSEYIYTLHIIEHL